MLEQLAATATDYLLEAPGAKQSSRLMTEITKRVKDPGYGDKDALNKLLNWYFANLRRD